MLHLRLDLRGAGDLLEHDRPRSSEAVAAALHPTSRSGTGPTFQPTIDMPPTNTRDEEGDAQRPHVDGRPASRLPVHRPDRDHVRSTAAPMNVISPWTKKTNIAATPAGATNPTQCGIPGTATGQLGSTAARPIAGARPQPRLRAGRPGRSPAPTPTRRRHGVPPERVHLHRGIGIRIDARARGLDVQARTSTTSRAVPDGQRDDARPGASTPRPLRLPRGRLSTSRAPSAGQMTLAAENYIYVTGDPYNDKQPTCSAWSARTRSSSTTRRNFRRNGRHLLDADRSNRKIDAALLSVGHTFQVQNYDATAQPRHAHGLRRDRAEVPWNRGHVQRRHPEPATPRTTSTTPASGTSPRRSS